MSATHIKGGLPIPIIQGTADVAVGMFEWAGGASNFLMFENLSAANDIVLSFCLEDATAGVGMVVPAVVGSVGNPLLLPVEAGRFWVQALAAAAFRALVLVRRG